MNAFSSPLPRYLGLLRSTEQLDRGSRKENRKGGLSVPNLFLSHRLQTDKGQCKRKAPAKFGSSSIPLSSPPSIFRFRRLFSWQCRARERERIGSPSTPCQQRLRLKTDYPPERGLSTTPLPFPPPLPSLSLCSHFPLCRHRRSRRLSCCARKERPSLPLRRQRASLSFLLPFSREPPYHTARDTPASAGDGGGGGASVRRRETMPTAGATAKATATTRRRQSRGSRRRGRREGGRQSDRNRRPEEGRGWVGDGRDGWIETGRKCSGKTEEKG